MSIYLIQNGVNKRNTTWINQNDKQSGTTYAGSSATIAWNQSSKLKITTFINGYVSNLSGWNAGYDASSYAYLYVTCYTDSLNSGYGNARLQITKYGNDDDTGISQAITSTSTQYKISLSSLSSAYKASLQTYLYYRDYRTGNAVMNRSAYISNMWLTQNFTITYYANGGSGAPSAQTFEEGSRTLSTTKPTRSGYSFQGWSESNSATSATYAAGGTIDLNGNKNLYAVWKAELSTVSANNGVVGNTNSVTINITQQGDNRTYNHTLKYSVSGNNGTASGTIDSNITGSSQTISRSWTPPASIASKVTNAKTCSCTISCETYSGSTLLGNKTCAISLSNENYAVTIGSHYFQRQANSYPSLFTQWVKDKTPAEFFAEATTYQSARISKWEYTINGTTTTVNETSTSSTVSRTYVGAAPNQAGNLPLVMKVTDSRGYTATKTATVSVADYAAPSVTSLSMARADSNGDLDAQGEFLKITATINVTSLNSMNYDGYQFNVKYKKQSDNSWLPDPVTSDYQGNLGADHISRAFGNNISFTWLSPANGIPPPESIVEESYSYDTRLIITDFYGSYTFSSTVSTALSIMDFKANGLGVAFGKVHTEADRTVEIADDWAIVQDGKKIAPLVAEDVSVDDITVSADSMGAIDVPFSKTGYSPLGIVGWAIANATNNGQYHTYVFPMRIAFSTSTNVRLWVRNIYTSNAKVKVTVRILYVRS